MDFLKKKMKELMDDDKDEKKDKPSSGTQCQLRFCTPQLTFIEIPMEVLPVAHPVALAMASVQRPMTTTVEALPLLSNSNSTHPKVRVILLRVKVILPKATLSSSRTARDHPLSVLLRPMALLPQCLQAGLSNGTRIASDGSTSSRQPAARSGILPRICLQAPTLPRHQARLTTRPAAMTSAHSSATLMATRVMITLPLVMPPTRRRRRRTRTRATRPLCLPLQV